MQLSFIFILLPFISTAFASPLRILDNNIQAISERDRWNLPTSVDKLPKHVESNLLLPCLKSRGAQIAGKWSDPTYRLKEAYGGHSAMFKTIRRNPKQAEEQKRGFIHETVYLEREGMLLACAENPMWYFLVIKDDGYEDVSLTTQKMKALGKAARKSIDEKYGEGFVNW
ncbi:hypothetical protein F5887DRAFT_1074202 [Amanita rubescens]|nr:hypothetical protein F5887DRAFT_1074202 [Amanita rubescens]